MNRNIISRGTVHGDILNARVLADAVYGVHHQVPDLQIGVGENGLGGFLFRSRFASADVPSCPMGGGEIEQSKFGGDKIKARGKLTAQHGDGLLRGRGEEIPTRAVGRRSGVSLVGEGTDHFLLLHLGGAENGSHISVLDVVFQIFPQKCHISAVSGNVAGGEIVGVRGQTACGESVHIHSGHHRRTVGNGVPFSEISPILLDGEQFSRAQHIRDALGKKGGAGLRFVFAILAGADDHHSAEIVRKTTSLGIDHRQVFVRKIYFQSGVQNRQFTRQNLCRVGVITLGGGQFFDLAADGRGEKCTHLLGYDDLAGRGNADLSVYRFRETLRLHVKGADAVDLITEQFDAVGRRRRGIDVHDAAAYGELAGTFHQFSPYVAGRTQGGGQLFRIHAGVYVNRHRQGREQFLRNRDLQSRLRGRGDNQRLRVKQERRQHPQTLVLVIVGGGDIVEIIVPGRVLQRRQTGSLQKGCHGSRILFLRGEDQNAHVRKILHQGRQKDVCRSVGQPGDRHGTVPSRLQRFADGGDHISVFAPGAEQIGEQFVVHRLYSVGGTVAVAQPHSPLHLTVKNHLRRFLDQGETAFQSLFIFTAEHTQHPGRQIVLGIGLLSYAEADAGEFVASQPGDDILQSVLTAVGSALADPHPSRILAYVVHQDQDILRGNLVKGCRLGYGVARQIHKGLGLHQQHPMGADLCLAAEGLEFQTAHVRTQLGGQMVQRHKARVVAGFLVFLARIAKPRNDMCRCGGGGGVLF